MLDEVPLAVAQPLPVRHVARQIDLLKKMLIWSLERRLYDPKQLMFEIFLIRFQLLQYVRRSTIF